MKSRVYIHNPFYEDVCLGARHILTPREKENAWVGLLDFEPWRYIMFTSSICICKVTNNCNIHITYSLNSCYNKNTSNILLTILWKLKNVMGSFASRFFMWLKIINFSPSFPLWWTNHILLSLFTVWIIVFIDGVSLSIKNVLITLCFQLLD